MTYQGLTWDHPRGYDALAEAARRVNAGRSAPLIHWEKQPLEGFEGAPIGELAAANDLIVLDHPHIGEAVVEDCLIPLEDLFSAHQIARWRAASVGPSMSSYQWADKTWALPLDVATQVVARRPDILAQVPASWDEMEALSHELPVALSLAGPHAFLTLISRVGATGAPVGGTELMPDETAIEALAWMHKLAARAPAGSAELNPIELLEAMAHSDEIGLIPLVFGYVTYARDGHAPYRVAFSDTPRAPGGKGGVLGGTGIGFSRRCTPSSDLLEHIASLMDETTQMALLPAFGGQPSARAAWQSETVNQSWGGFYHDTLQTAENTLLRPRFNGFIPFQYAAADRIRTALSTDEDETRTLTALRALWHDARHSARGPLT